MPKTNSVSADRTVALPLLKWALYGLAVLFTWQMIFVKFDYGWAVLVMGSLAACHFAVWLPWCAREILAGKLRGGQHHDQAAFGGSFFVFVFVFVFVCLFVCLF
jgi:hypothetical protein